MKKITVLILALSFTITATAQISITGTVSNDSIPLELASIIIKNSTKGVVTNSKGEFKLGAKKGDTLSVSYLGYKTKEVVLNESESFKFKLDEDNYLDEVLVVGYSPREFQSYGCRPYYITDETNLDHNNIEQNKLFPNPSSNGIFQLKLTETYNEVKISISNMSGRIIQNSTYQKFGQIGNIDLSQFKTGIYIINIMADGKPMESIKAIKG